MGHNKEKGPSLGDVLRRSSLLEKAVCVALPCGIVEREGDEPFDLATLHVHSLSVWLSAASRGPRIQLEFRLHRSEEVIKGGFPCDKLEGPLQSFLDGEVDYGGMVGVRKYVDVSHKEAPPLMPALYTLQRTFRDSELEHPKKAAARLQELEHGRSTRMPCVRIDLEDFMKALEGDLVQRFTPDGDDEWVRMTQRRDLERGTELFLGRIPNPSRHEVAKDGNVYFKSKYFLEGGAIVRLTAPVVASIRILVGGLAENESLKELLRQLYGT